MQKLKKTRLMMIGGITFIALFFLSLGLSQTRLLPGAKITLVAGGSNVSGTSKTSVPFTSPGDSGTTSTFTPNASPWTIVAVKIILGIIATSGIILLIIRFQGAKARQTSPLMRLADQAQEALNKLEEGGDLRNIVLRCYYEMTKILLEKKSMKREKSMTPREFETELIAKDLPVESVKMLTRLFEEVRYGSTVPGDREERMATSSLTAIIEACQEKE